MAARHGMALTLYTNETSLRDVAISFVVACDEAEGEGVDPSTDAAVLLIGHQLAFLTHADSMSRRMVSDLISICESNTSVPIDPMVFRSH